MTNLDSDTPNADAVLNVRFYPREVEMPYLTDTEGRPIKSVVDFIEIAIPGNILTRIDTVATDEHKKRFPVHWAQYSNAKSMDASQVQGTLLSDWTALTPPQVLELKRLQFFTLEQVAAASDQQIASVGMLVGMSPQAFRDRARAYLAQAGKTALANEQAEEIRRRDEQIAKLEAEGRARDAQMQALQEQMQKLLGDKDAKKTPRGKGEKAAAEGALA